MKLDYQQKGSDNRTTIYRFEITTSNGAFFDGVAHRHNGEFVYVNGHFYQAGDVERLYGWPFLCRDVVLENQQVLKLYLHREIRRFILEIRDVYHSDVKDELYTTEGVLLV